jgi:hypothetical protein
MHRGCRGHDKRNHKKTRRGAAKAGASGSASTRYIPLILSCHARVAPRTNSEKFSPPVHQICGPDYPKNQRTNQMRQQKMVATTQAIQAHQNHRPEPAKHKLHQTRVPNGVGANHDGSLDGYTSPPLLFLTSGLSSSPSSSCTRALVGVHSSWFTNDGPSSQVASSAVRSPWDSLASVFEQRLSYWSAW